ncbi:HK97 gp10 family phage protein [Microbacterium sp. ISL-103]|uniref:HK97 gp10 family phage protein n=1 Tax=Microbacterium sp. ISL-103 TaxID=2819156 RepID=UPI001BE551F0|nr:HK97 gp10 family phage protein [Microbacterium sp. ISL-103]MBT2473308.1 HK97 gp10 family phage protein [Microbacterium sp. ISL-103]
MATTWDNDAMDELARGAGITGAVVEAAERIADQVRADAPVDTEDYKNSIRVTVKQQRRSVALVESTDPKALVIEAKTGVMARAAKKSARSR